MHSSIGDWASRVSIWALRCHRILISGGIVAHLATAAFLTNAVSVPAGAAETVDFDELVRDLSGDDVALRRAAARALSERPDARAVEPLSRALHDDDETTRVMAAVALQKIAGRIATDALAGTLSDADPRIRHIAAAGLKKMHQSSVEEAGKQPVLGLENALRWLPRTLPATDVPPTAFLEMASGDGVPGTVTAYRPGRWTPPGWQPPHLLVEPGPGLQRMGPMSGRSIRVRTGWLRKIVWDRREKDEYRPATIVGLGGRRILFRSFRWEGDGIRALTESGTRRFLFRDMAELHLPEFDPWQAWLEQLTLLSPGCESRLIYLGREDGLRITCSEERVRAFADVKSASPGDWKHLIQPAWSLDPLVTEHIALFLIADLPAHEMPLTILSPRTVVQQSPLAGVPLWRVNRNVRGGQLESGGFTARWGYGVHADCDLRFQLPRLVEGVRTRVGLDKSVGDGGCARAVVRIEGRHGSPLYTSPLLVGSARCEDTRVLTFDTPLGDSATLVLAADSAHLNRPRGADPLNIRDRLDWLEPTLTFDPERLRGEVTRVACTRHPAWQQWDVQIDGEGPAPFVNRVVDSADGTSRFAFDVASQGRAITFSAKRPITADDRWLYLDACQIERTEPAGKFEFRVAGETLAHVTVPPPGTPGPLLVPLGDPPGDNEQLPDVQVVYQPGSVSERLDWQALELMPRVTRVAWQPLQPVQTQVFGVSQLTAEPDGTLLASGKQNYAETFVIDATVELPQIRALRLEVLADPDRPAGGPGRNSNGNFHLAHFQATTSPPARNPFRGRFVRVSLPGADRPLRLAEVQVFAPPPTEDFLREQLSLSNTSEADDARANIETAQIRTILDTPADRRSWPQQVRLASCRDNLCQNIALEGKVIQSTASTEGQPGRAIDDDPFTAGAETLSQEDPWWELDLGEDRPIDRILVWNPPHYYFKDQLSRFEVTVFDSDRRVVLRREGLPDPMPVLEINQSGERVIPIATAEASAFQQWGDYRADRSLDFTTRGWATGVAGQSHAATYVFEEPVDVQAAGLRIYLRHCRGGVWQTAGTIGRFRLYATSDPPPILVEPVGEEVAVLVDDVR